ncbi:MAG: hypothetical protein Pg6A_19500 [Termitinemataceae bacterium]|nr:MAG: hypothetical protein Pg6A_19500 [Termitinemataceae bacterium]
MENVISWKCDCGSIQSARNTVDKQQTICNAVCTRCQNPWVRKQLVREAQR